MLGKFLAFLLGIAGVIAGSQAPNFTTNFMQNLEGRVDERKLDYDRISERWDYFNVDRDSVEDDCREKADDNSNPQASCLEDVLIVERYELLNELQTELKNASDWERPILLGKAVIEGNCKSVDMSNVSSKTQNSLNQLCVRYLAENTAKEYEPAVPVTVDGAAYAAGGGLGLWAIFRILFGILGLPFRPRYS